MTAVSSFKNPFSYVEYQVLELSPPPSSTPSIQGLQVTPSPSLNEPIVEKTQKVAAKWVCGCTGYRGCLCNDKQPCVAHCFALCLCPFFAFFVGAFSFNSTCAGGAAVGACYGFDILCCYGCCCPYPKRVPIEKNVPPPNQMTRA